jgi:hypothetical protein
VAKYCHTGVPVKKPQANEIFIEAAKVHITDPAAHPYQFEFLRFEPGSPMAKEVQTKTHIAFEVPNLDAALKGEKVIVQPFDATPTLRVAFIIKDGVVVELMQPK